MSIINTYMKDFLKLFKRNSGFTLIELLVVIGILGVLAAALIATIDPFEQIKKANDSNTKNAAVEFNDALLRYYATHTAFPWDANGDANCEKAGIPSSTVLYKATDKVPLSPCVTALTSENELKSAFGTDINDLQDIYLTYVGGTTNDTIVCFQPHSQSQQNAAVDNADGTTTGSTSPKVCGFTGGVPDDLKSGCFWCTQSQ